MIKLIRDYRVILAAGLLVVSVVVYMLYGPSRPLPANPLSDARPSVSTPSVLSKQPDSRQDGASSVPQSDRIPISAWRDRTYTSKGAKFSPAQLESDQRVVAATLQKIHESLAKAEFDQSKLMEEKTFPGGHGAEKIIEVRPIPKEIAEAAYAELSQGLQSLSKDSPQVERLKNKALSEIASFTDRPKPFEVLMLTILDDNAENINITQLFVDDLKLLARDAQGRIPLNLGTGPGQEILRSGDYGKSDEWTKRYSHFFEKVP